MGANYTVPFQLPITAKLVATRLSLLQSELLLPLAIDCQVSKLLLLLSVSIEMESVRTKQMWEFLRHQSHTHN
jgi:hypothetical protein